MSVALIDMMRFLEQCLQPGRFRDDCPNGLQVQGRAEVARLVTGVTACQELLDAAITWKADAILVHHGYFWQGEASVVVGMKRRRLAALLGHDISLIAYHLPLDAHPELGNNARLGQLLGLRDHLPLQPETPESVGNVANLDCAVPVSEFIAEIERVTGRHALHIDAGPARIQRIAWCTGAAQSYIGAAVSAQADLYLTGEVSEQTVHVAREEGIHLVAAGHHATERFGVQALGQELSQRFGLQHQFIDIDNPV